MYVVLSSLLFALSSNLDNIVVGIAYGIKKIKIGFLSNLIIGFITSLGTLLSMYAGSYIAKLINPNLANKIGASIIILLGLYFVIQSIISMIKDKKFKELALKDIDDMVDYAVKTDKDESGHIGIKEAFIVAFGLTLNNLGNGIAASITGVDIKLTVIFTFILSIAALLLGSLIGNNVIGKICGKYAPLVSGVLLMLLGAIEMFN